MGSSVLDPYTDKPESRSCNAGAATTRARETQERSPFAAQGKPFEAQGKPFEAQGKPFEAQGKPFEAQGKPFAAQGKPFAAQGKPFEAQGKQERLCHKRKSGLACGFVFGAEGSQARMVQAIAAHEMDHQQHEQGSKDHDGRGGLQADLQVANVRDAPDQQWAERT